MTGRCSGRSGDQWWPCPPWFLLCSWPPCVLLWPYAWPWPPVLGAAVCVASPLAEPVASPLSGSLASPLSGSPLSASVESFFPQSECAASETALPCALGSAPSSSRWCATDETYSPWFFRPAGQSEPPASVVSGSPEPASVVSGSPELASVVSGSPEPASVVSGSVVPASVDSGSVVPASVDSASGVSGAANCVTVVVGAGAEAAARATPPPATTAAAAAAAAVARRALPASMASTEAGVIRNLRMRGGVPAGLAGSLVQPEQWGLGVTAPPRSTPEFTRTAQPWSHRCSPTQRKPSSARTSATRRR